ncbi:MAG: hypothetical protein IKV96_01360, partial [Firmicutes bacterium]|nr:hypothetical protein [Bacillota bacterium]
CRATTHSRHPSAPRAKVKEQGLTKKKVLLGFYWFWGTSKTPKICGTLCGTMEIEKAKSLDIARLLAFWGLMSGNSLALRA